MYSEIRLFSLPFLPWAVSVASFCCSEGNTPFWEGPGNCDICEEFCAWKIMIYVLNFVAQKVLAQKKELDSVQNRSGPGPVRVWPVQSRSRPTLDRSGPRSTISPKFGPRSRSVRSGPIRSCTDEQPYPQGDRTAISEPESLYEMVVYYHWDVYNAILWYILVLRLYIVSGFYILV